ncbi:hypothetical protein JTB14_029610 [Gonioctena quinquepunctata]|nr:hypothetical protein JTB14_029610 [Gonioctena quinquepunctata]
MLLFPFILTVSIVSCFESIEGENVEIAHTNIVVRQSRSVVIPDDIEDLLQPELLCGRISWDEAEDDGDVQGFSKKTNANGNDGYKHFDSYHKKDANKYGFELFSKFGKAKKASVDTNGENEKYAEEEADEDESR